MMNSEKWKIYRAWEEVFLVFEAEIFVSSLNVYTRGALGVVLVALAA